MKKLTSILLLMLTIPLYAQHEVVMTPKKLLKDFKIYRAVLEKSHSGLYLYTPKTKFDSIFDAAMLQLKNEEITTLRDFNTLLAKVHTQINCGHSNIFPSSQLFNAAGDEAKVFFPLKVKFIQDKCILAENYRHLTKGTEIVSINGVRFDAIRKKGHEVLASDGYNTTMKDRYLEEEFSNYYYLLYGPSDHFKLVIKKIASNSNEGTYIEGGNNTRRKQLLHQPKLKDYTFSIQDDSYAILTVNSFDTDQKAFFSFLRKSFRKLRSMNINNLIIDIRQNEGGQDGNDTKLASYLINTPFKDNKTRILNTTDLPLYAEYLDAKWYEAMDIPAPLSNKKLKKEFKQMLEEEFYKGDDSRYYYKDKYTFHETPNEYRFKGNTYILTGGKVFSAGALFAALVKDKSDALFIGEETGGGYYQHTGSIPLYYKLPHSGIEFSLSIAVNKQDIDRKLMPEGRGVIPDFKVHQTVSDLLSNTDTVLAFAKNKIAQSQVDSKELLTITKVLASDTFAGRGTGDNSLAQDYIINYFKKHQIKAFHTDYKQPFTFIDDHNKTRPGTNIIGYIKGKKYPHKYIVLSAHYDHLGIIDGAIFNGADDNASGTAAIMVLAKYFANNPPDHSIIFAAFDAEELGLHGAIAFMKTAPVATTDLILNVNLDMISRNDHNEIYVAGTYAFPELKPFIEKAAQDAPVKVSYGHDDPHDKKQDYWMNSTDNVPFTENGIPNVYFGEEDHPDYHQTTDDFENIHPIYFKNVVNVIFKSVLALDQHFVPQAKH